MAECPLSAAISLGNEDCFEDFESIAKILIRRRGNAELDDTAITTLAGITPLLAAADSTKIVISPKLWSSVTEPGGIIEDDKQWRGIKLVIGEEAAKVNAKIRPDSALYSQLKALQGESLEVAPISKNDMYMAKEGSTGTKLEFIPIESFFIGALAMKGDNNGDECELSFSFASDYYANTRLLEPVAPFSALYDIENP